MKKSQQVSKLLDNVLDVQGRMKHLNSITTNKATEGFGAYIRQGKSTSMNGGGALCGGSHPFDFTMGFIHSVHPGAIEIAWEEPVCIAFVAFRFYDMDSRVYTYDFEYLDRGGTWHRVCRDQCGSSWQRCSLSSSWRALESVEVAALRWFGVTPRSQELRIVDIRAI